MSIKNEDDAMLSSIMSGTPKEEHFVPEDEDEVTEVDEDLIHWEEFALMMEEHLLIVDRFNKNPKKIVGNKIYS